jgi:CheY-like chemotaxis protein
MTAVTLPSIPSILVVEDSDEDFDTVQIALKASGQHCVIRRAINGKDCLDRLRGSRRVLPRPAFVLLDLNLPGMDGRDALSLIKGDPDMRDLPVVVLTTSSNPKDLGFCYHAGVNAFHVKPLRHDEHLDLLRRVLAYWLGCAVLPNVHEAAP